MEDKLHLGLITERRTFQSMGVQMDDPRKVYKAVTLRILGNFQLLEFGLKGYIGLAYSIIRKAVGTTLQFGYSVKDVEAYPLERLINVFSKSNTNMLLQSRLNKLRAERNHIAHRSLLATMGRMYDPGAIEDKYIEYFELEDELTECLQLVIEETRLLKPRSKPIPNPEIAAT